MDTFLVFMLGVSTTLTAATGVIAFIALRRADKYARKLVISEAKRLQALEMTRRDIAAVLAELKRFTGKQQPLRPAGPVKADFFADVLGHGLARYEERARLAAVASEIAKR